MPGCAGSGCPRTSAFRGTSSTSAIAGAGGACGCPARRWTGWSTCWSCATTTRAARRSSTRATRCGWPGAFGDKSVIEFPGYRRPDWLERPAAPATETDLAIGSRELGSTIRGRLWSAEALAADQPAPLLIVHDGPEYGFAGRADPVRRSADPRRPAAAAADGDAGTGGSQPVVRGEPGLRPGADRRGAAGAGRAGAQHRPDRCRRQPRRAGDAARAPAGLDRG